MRQRMLTFLATLLSLTLTPLFMTQSVAQTSSSVKQQVVPALPEAVSNNAVAQVKVGEQQVLLSFMGLGKGKTHEDVHNKAWSWTAGADQWQAIPPVPAEQPLAGRLAAVAIGIGDQAYLFGGYTVAEDHTEVSATDSYRYDVAHEQYHLIADMPVAVDDSIALAYQNRYIYLVSGWHNSGNVNLVQVYDTETNEWQQATPPSRSWRVWSCRRHCR